MEKKLAITIGVLAILLLVYFMLGNRQNTNVNWKEDYKLSSKEPYGTHVMGKLIEDVHNLKKINEDVHQNLPKGKNKRFNYIFVGEHTYYDTSDVNRLIEFVDNGNNVLISSKSISLDLMDFIFDDIDCYDVFWNGYKTLNKDSLNLNLKHPNLNDTSLHQANFLNRFRPSDYRWSYIDTSYLCEGYSNIVPLGHYGDDPTQINFAKLSYGENEGAFYLHTTPLIFSNIQLKKESNLAYVEKVLGHLPAGVTYWDEHSKIRTTPNVRRRMPEVELPDKGPLEFIISNKSTRAAWYLLIGLTLLFLLFRAKRKQREIPIIAPNNNTSLEFIETIGRLYFLQNDHKKLAKQKMRLFLAHIREHYKLATQNIDDKLIQRIIQKSELSEDKVRSIFKWYKTIDKQEVVNEMTLINFHKAIDYFYKNRK